MSHPFAPSIRALLPEGWVVKESITLLAPDGMANVIASSEPLDASMDTYDYAETQGRILRTEFDQYDEDFFGPRLIYGGRPGYMRVFSWAPPDGERVTQIQLYYALPGQGFTATATTPTSEFSRFEVLLRQCLDDLMLELAA